MPLLADSSSGNFLVSPSLGVMIWTLIAFLVALYLLNKLAFPRISEALEKRQKTIEESIDSAVRTREEAEQLLADGRAYVDQSPVDEMRQGREHGTASAYRDAAVAVETAKARLARRQGTVQAHERV